MRPYTCLQAGFIENNYAFCGVQSGNQCWCGNKAPSLDDLLPKSDCNTPCRAKETVMCGAGMKNNIYKESGRMLFLQDSAKV